MVDTFTYDLKEYYKNIPVALLAKRFLKLSKLNDFMLESEVYVDGENLNICIDMEENKMYLNDNYINPEEFILLMIGDKKNELDPVIFIKEITGVDLDDYIDNVWYLDGKYEKFNVKKTLNNRLQNFWLMV